MKIKRNEKLECTEIYIDSKLKGISFSVDDLWKRKVYITYYNNSNRTKKGQIHRAS